MKLVHNTGTQTKLSFALGYAALGWKVFPLWNIGEDGRCACKKADCQSEGKHPLSQCAPKGQDSATTDTDTIKRWWGRYPNANIAAHLASSGLCAIDIDPRNGGMYTIETIEAEHGPLTSDVLQFTGGGGEHRIFQLPPHQTLPGKLGDGIDVKTNGYIVLEPSNHISGGSYLWEGSSDPLQGAIPSPLPDWLRDLTRNAPVYGKDSRVESLSEEQVIELRSALFFIDSDDRETWVTVGMALHNYAWCGLGFELWNEWSSESPKYVYKDQLRTWNSFKHRNGGITKLTLFKLAQDAGWINTAAMPDLDIDIDVLISQVKPEQAEPEEKPEPKATAKNTSQTPGTYEFPKHLLNVPGLVGDIASYMSATARFPQPVLELGASLAFCGALMGRKIRTESNIRTNIYTIGINYSGTGKEHARKCIKNLSVWAGVTDYVGAEKIASDAGLFNLLDMAPSTLWLADEFGRVLRAMNDGKAPSYLQQLSTQIMELSGSADSFAIESRKASTGQDKNPIRIIQNPNLCIYGTTVPGRLFAALTPDEIVDGFLPRWLLFESDVQDQEPQNPGYINCDGLIVQIKDWADMPINAYPEGNIDFLIPNPKIAPTDKQADSVFFDYEKMWRKRKNDYVDTGIDAIWARAYEHALRIALIRAGGVNLDNPTIDKDCAEWACELTDFLLRRSSAQALDCVAKNDHDGTIKKISAFIRDNSPVQRKVLAIKFQHIKATHRNEMLAQLVEAEVISIEKTQMSSKGGPTTVVFKWIG